MMHMTSSSICCSSITSQSSFVTCIGCGGQSPISVQARRGRRGGGGASSAHCKGKKECSVAWVWSSWRLGSRIHVTQSLDSRWGGGGGRGLGEPGSGLGWGLGLGIGRGRRNLSDDGGGGGGGSALDIRGMGGGPRTFPGGVTKWQWRRMQEKKKRTIELKRIGRMKEEGQPPPYLWDPTRKEREDFYKTMRSGSRRKAAMQWRSREDGGATAEVAQEQSPFRGGSIGAQDVRERTGRDDAINRNLRDGRGREVGIGRSGGEGWRGGEANVEGGSRRAPGYGYGGPSGATRLERYLQETKDIPRRSSGGIEDEDEDDDDDDDDDGEDKDDTFYDDAEEDIMDARRGNDAGSRMYTQGDMRDRRSGYGTALGQGRGGRGSSGRGSGGSSVREGPGRSSGSSLRGVDRSRGSSVRGGMRTEQPVALSRSRDPRQSPSNRGGGSSGSSVRGGPGRSSGSSIRGVVDGIRGSSVRGGVGSSDSSARGDMRIEQQPLALSRSQDPRQSSSSGSSVRGVGRSYGSSITGGVGRSGSSVRGGMRTEQPLALSRSQDPRQSSTREGGGPNDVWQGAGERRKGGREEDFFDILAEDEEESEEEEEEEEDGGEINEYDEGEWGASLAAAGVKSGLSGETQLRAAGSAPVVLKDPWEREEYWQPYGGPKAEMWAQLQEKYNKEVPEDIREMPDPLRTARIRHKALKVPKLVLVSSKGELMPWLQKEEKAAQAKQGGAEQAERESRVVNGRGAATVARGEKSGSGVAESAGSKHPSELGGSLPSPTELQVQNSVAGELADVESAATPEHLLSHARFDAFKLSKVTLRALADLGCENATLLQEAAIPQIVRGKDLLVGGNTGGGKRLSFLIPAVEVVERVDAKKSKEEEKEGSAGEDTGKNDVTVLIITPTRDSVQSIRQTAALLTSDHRDISLQTITGGSRVNSEQSRLLHDPCRILIGSAGRLLDHLQNTIGFPERLSKLKLLVLDDTAELLRLGFRPLIESILRYLPTRGRQTCIFSSTLPPQLFSLVHNTLRPDHVVLDMVKAAVPDSRSEEHVLQEYMIVPIESHLVVLYQMLRLHMEEEENFKVVVFCVSTPVTAMTTELMQGLGLPVAALHPGLERPERIRIANEFRLGTRTILITSDSTARGDYPGVTLVVQVGLPLNRDQYLFRVRRSDKNQGTSMLLLYPFEKFFLGYLRDLTIEECAAMPIDPFSEDKVAKALKKVDVNARIKAYQDFLGYYKNHRDLVWDSKTLVQHANVYSKGIGFHEPPVISLRVALALGLSRVKGVRAADIF